MSDQEREDYSAMDRAFSTPSKEDEDKNNDFKKGLDSTKEVLVKTKGGIPIWIWICVGVVLFIALCIVLAIIFR
jgi:hypothetical protein